MLSLVLKSMHKKENWNDLLSVVKANLQVEEACLEKFMSDLNDKKKELIQVNQHFLKYPELIYDNNEAKKYEIAVMFYLIPLLTIDNYMSYHQLNQTECLVDNLWGDSMDGKMKNVTSLAQEVQNTLYNFAVIKFIYGFNLIFGKNQIEQDLDNGLMKLRNCLWALQQIRNLQSGKQEFLDLGFDQILLVEYYALMLCYASQYMIDGGVDKMTYSNRQKVAGLAQQTDISLHSILENLSKMKDNSSINKKLKQEIENNCRSLQYYYKIQANYSMCLYYEGLSQDKVDAGYFGKAIGFLQDCQKLIEQHAQNINASNLVMVKDMKIMVGIVKEKMQDMVIRNDQIYKDEIKVTALIYLDEQFKIDPKMPEKFKNLQDPKLEPYIGQKVGQIQRFCKKYNEDCYENMKNQFYQYRQSKENSYNDHNVNYLMNIVTEEKVNLLEQIEHSLLPESINQNVQNLFNTQNMMNAGKGGQNMASENLINRIRSEANTLSLSQKIQVFQMMSQKIDISQGIQNLENVSKASQNLINELGCMLDQEMAQDCKYQQSYNKQWTRQTSTIVQREMRLKIQDLASKYRIANNVDQPLFQKYQQYKGYYVQLKTNPNILNLNSKQQMRLKYSEPLMSIRSENQRIEKQEQSIQEIIKISQQYMQTHQILKKVKGMLNLSQQQIKDQVFGGLSKLQQQFSTQLNALQSDLNSICIQSDQLNEIITKDREIVDIKQDQNLVNSVQTFIDIYLQLEQGVSFYHRLYNILLDHKQSVNDLCMARQIEANNLVSLIENNKKYGMYRQ